MSKKQAKSVPLISCSHLHKKKQNRKKHLRIKLKLKFIFMRISFLCPKVHSIEITWIHSTPKVCVTLLTDLYLEQKNFFSFKFLSTSIEVLYILLWNHWNERYNICLNVYLFLFFFFVYISANERAYTVRMGAQ